MGVRPPSGALLTAQENMPISEKKLARKAKFQRIHRLNDEFRYERIRKAHRDSYRQIGNNRVSSRATLYPVKWDDGPTSDYMRWRYAVLSRDGFKCVKCDSTDRLEADHLRPRSIYPDLTYDVDNGQTLCHDCHAATETYGKKIHGLVAVSVDNL